MHHKDLRDLAEKINEKSQAAAALVRKEDCTPEDEARAEELVTEAEGLQRRFNLLKKTTNGQGLLEELEAEDREQRRTERKQRREDLRSRATAAASRTVSDTNGSESEPEEIEEVEISEGHLTAGKRFMSIFGDLLAEYEARMPSENRQRLDAFRVALRFGPDAIKDPEIRAMVVNRPGKEAREEMSHFSIRTESRAMSLANSSSLGILVPPEAMGPIRLARKAFGGFRSSKATRIATSHGRAIPLPTVDDTRNEGSYRGESQQVGSATDPLAEPHELYAYGLTSGIMKVSNELGQDQQFGLETFLSNLGTVRNERRFQRSLTTGTGVSQPTGLVPSVSVGVTAQAPASLVPADFYDLKDSVDPSYWTNAEWMLSPKALLATKKMDSGIDTPLWQPSFAVGEPPTIDGDPYVVNTHMATLASGNRPVLFGDHSWMFYREVEPPIFVILRELFAGNMETGYILFARNDGRYLNAGDPIKALEMP